MPTAITLTDDVAQDTFLTGEDPESMRGVKRTPAYRGQTKFNGPIVVHENLFTPATVAKQINVQILEPENHNNGQFLKETTYVKQENSTSVSSTSTTTTTSTSAASTSPTTAAAITSTAAFVGPYSTTTQKLLSGNFLAPIQTGVRLTNEARQQLEEDCLDASSTTPLALPRKEEQRTVVNVHKNVRVNKILVTPVPYGARKLVGVPTKRPCDSGKCGEQSTRTYLPPPSTTQQPPLPTPTRPPVPIVPVVPVRVVHQPVIIHTQTEVPVEKIVPVEVEKLVVKEVKVPVDRIVTVPKFIEKHVPVDRIVEKPVFVEKHVPVDRIVEKFIDRPITQIVEKFVDRPITQIVEKFVDRPVTQIVEKIVDRPVEVEKIVEKQVPVERVVAIDRPIPIQVGVPVEIPYLVHVEVPIHAPYPYPVHMPYLIKSPPLKQHYIIKTSKAKDHGFFDFKHNYHKTVKHIFLKQPPIGLGEDPLHSPHPYPFDTYRLFAPPPPPPPPSLPSPIAPIAFQPLDAIQLNLNHLHYEHREPRYQSVNNFDSQASGSQNVVSTALPSQSLNAYHSHHFHSHKNLVAHQAAPRQNFPGSLNIKELRWEYGFKPPLVPSTEIDDQGNPVKKTKWK